MADDVNPDIEAMIDAYGEETVRVAFEVAYKIGTVGYPGIDFSGAAEREIRQSYYGVTRENVRSEVQKNLRML